MPDRETDAASDSRGGSQAISLGERLRSARKARAISLEQAARVLHLDKETVAALEADDFTALGAPVFVKGHLRSYAELLGLPPDDIVEAYRLLNPTVDEMQARIVKPQLAERTNVASWSFWAMVIIAALLVTVYLFQRDETFEPATGAGRVMGVEGTEVEADDVVRVEVASTDSAQPIEPQQPEERLEPQPSSPEPVREAADADTDVPAPFEEPAASDRSEPDGRAAVVAEATGDTEPVEVAPAPAANSPSDESERTEPRVLLSGLTFVFVDDSWTEITDARGRILYGLQREGTRRELAGVPPFAIFLGNAGGVEIFVDGSRYTISPEVRRGNTARFQIEPAINP